MARRQWIRIKTAETGAQISSFQILAPLLASEADSGFALQLDVGEGSSLAPDPCQPSYHSWVWKLESLERYLNSG